MNALLTVPEVAQRLRVSEDHVRNELRRKNMRGSNIGRGRTGGWRVSEADLEAYIAARANITPVRRRAG